MTQIARPDSTIQGGHSLTGAETIHEALSDQSDDSFIHSNSVEDTVCTLQNLSDPGGNTGYVLRWRNSGSSGTGFGSLTLYQGLPPSAGGSGTEIVSETLANAASPTDDSVTLAGAEADAITDFTDLYIEYEKTGGTASRQLFEVWFEVPSAAQTEQYGIATETDTALAALSRKGAGYNLASESDEALAFVATKLATYGIAPESDAALAFTAELSTLVEYGVAAEVDTALAFAAELALEAEYGISAETDSALPFVAHKHPGGGAYFPTGSVHSPFMLKPPPTRRRRNR